MTSKKKTDEIRARLEAATPGNWQHINHANYIEIWSETFKHLDGLIVGGSADENADNNVALMAHAPTDLAYLLDRVSKLEAVADAAEGLHSVYEDIRTAGDLSYRAIYAALQKYIDEYGALKIHLAALAEADTEGGG